MYMSVPIGPWGAYDPVITLKPLWGSRGSGTGPALTGVIDQGQGSKVGCWGEAVTK